MPLPPLYLVDRFPAERAALLDLLSSLTAVEWRLPTACAGWSVKDIAIHLYGDDIGRLSRGRDGEGNPDFATGLDISTYDGLVAAIDRQNAVWVTGNRRISTRQIIGLLKLTGEWTQEYFESLDQDAPGGPVDWAGPGPAPIWMDIAREFTERWMHQQHIRDAVGKPGFTERQWFHPVLDTFVRGIQRPLASLDAEPGATLRVIITGEAGGTWTAHRAAASWDLSNDQSGTATATVEFDQQTAWRLFTKGVSPDEARRSSRVDGDPDLAAAVFATVSILA